MKLGILKETYPNESRVAITPEIAGKLAKAGYTITVESGIGALAGYADSDYQNAGAHIANKHDVLKTAKIIATVSPMDKANFSLMNKDSVLIGMLKPSSHSELLDIYNGNQLTTFALERLPRITRAQSMDVLSSQSNLAGYRAVIEAAEIFGRALPLMMTAAGTIRPAKVLVLGAGVAGLQAIATAKRLGAIVSAFDVRTAAKEQVESLGASFVEVSVNEDGDNGAGYAQEMSDAYKKAQMAALAESVKNQDIIISTALIPGKPAPLLLTKAMVESMKMGSVIVDLASESGGNCELSVHGKTTTHQGVTIHAPYSILNNIAFNASQMYATNVYNFLMGLFKDVDGQLNFDMSDEIITNTLLTHQGNTVHPLFKVITEKAAPKPKTKKPIKAS